MPNLLIKTQKKFAKKRLNKKVDKHLRKNKSPLYISICTGFFNDKTSDSNFKSECDSSKKHGSHGVLIIGSRCKNNKIEYTIVLRNINPEGTY